MPGVIGVAGCGAMGLPMARRLRAAGFEVWGFDVRPAEEFGDFRDRMVADPADFATRCRTVLSVVRDARQTFDLCFDRQALFGTSPRPRRLILCSTLSPAVAHRVRARLPAETVLIDAPMSGAPHGAEEGTLSFMLGGPDDELDRIMPILGVLGAVFHRMGPVGAGHAAKVLNNFAAAASVVAVRRVLEAADALGFDRDRILAVMHTSSGQSWFASQFDRIAWSRQGYDPDNTIGILEKDVGCFVEAVSGLPGRAPGPFEEAVLAGVRALAPLDDDENEDE